MLRVYPWDCAQGSLPVGLRASFGVLGIESMLTAYKTIILPAILLLQFASEINDSNPTFGSVETVYTQISGYLGAQNMMRMIDD